MPIEQIVLELIFVAAETAITGVIAVVGAVFKDFQRLREDAEAKFA